MEKIYKSEDGIYRQCCACKSVATVQGEFVSLLDIENQDAIAFIHAARNELTVSHVHCPPCHQEVRKELKELFS